MPKYLGVKGFTLIEIIVAMSILAILAVTAFTLYSSTQISARDANRKSDLKEIATGLQIYRQNNNAYPTATIKSNQASWTTLLNNNYISAMPLDPVNISPYVYSYKSTAGATYDLCALLENTREKVKGNVIAGGGAPCGGAATDRFFYVTGL